MGDGTETVLSARQCRELLHRVQTLTKLAKAHCVPMPERTSPRGDGGEDAYERLRAHAARIELAKFRVANLRDAETQTDEVEVSEEKRVATVSEAAAAASTQTAETQTECDEEQVGAALAAVLQHTPEDITGDGDDPLPFLSDVSNTEKLLFFPEDIPVEIEARSPQIEAASVEMLNGIYPSSARSRSASTSSNVSSTSGRLHVIDNGTRKTSSEGGAVHPLAGEVGSEGAATGSSASSSAKGRSYEGRKSSGDTASSPKSVDGQLAAQGGELPVSSGAAPEGESAVEHHDISTPRVGDEQGGGRSSSESDFGFGDVEDALPDGTKKNPLAHDEEFASFWQNCENAIRGLDVPTIARNPELREMLCRQLFEKEQELQSSSSWHVNGNDRCASSSPDMSLGGGPAPDADPPRPASSSDNSGTSVEDFTFAPDVLTLAVDADAKSEEETRTLSPSPTDEQISDENRSNSSRGSKDSVPDSTGGHGSHSPRKADEKKRKGGNSGGAAGASSHDTSASEAEVVDPDKTSEALEASLEEKKLGSRSVSQRELVMGSSTSSLDNAGSRQSSKSRQLTVGKDVGALTIEPSTTDVTIVEVAQTSAFEMEDGAPLAYLPANLPKSSASARRRSASGERRTSDSSSKMSASRRDHVARMASGAAARPYHDATGRGFASNYAVSGGATAPGAAVPWDFDTTTPSSGSTASSHQRPPATARPQVANVLPRPPNNADRRQVHSTAQSQSLSSAAARTASLEKLAQRRSRVPEASESSNPRQPTRRSDSEVGGASNRRRFAASRGNGGQHPHLSKQGSNSSPSDFYHELVEQPGGMANASPGVRASASSRQVSGGPSSRAERTSLSSARSEAVLRTASGATAASLLKRSKSPADDFVPPHSSQSFVSEYSDESRHHLGRQHEHPRVASRGPKNKSQKACASVPFPPSGSMLLPKAARQDAEMNYSKSVKQLASRNEGIDDISWLDEAKDTSGGARGRGSPMYGHPESADARVKPNAAALAHSARGTPGAQNQQPGSRVAGTSSQRHGSSRSAAKNGAASARVSASSAARDLTREYQAGDYQNESFERYHNPGSSGSRRRSFASRSPRTKTVVVSSRLQYSGYPQEDHFDRAEPHSSDQPYEPPPRRRDDDPTATSNRQAAHGSTPSASSSSMSRGAAAAKERRSIGHAVVNSSGGGSISTRGAPVVAGAAAGTGSSSSSGSSSRGSRGRLQQRDTPDGPYEDMADTPPDPLGPPHHAEVLSVTASRVERAMVVQERERMPDVFISSSRGGPPSADASLIVEPEILGHNQERSREVPFSSAGSSSAGQVHLHAPLLSLGEETGQVDASPHETGNSALKTPQPPLNTAERRFSPRKTGNDAGSTGASASRVRRSVPESVILSTPERPPPGQHQFTASWAPRGVAPQAADAAVEPVDSHARSGIVVAQTGTQSRIGGAAKSSPAETADVPLREHKVSYGHRREPNQGAPQQISAHQPGFGNSEGRPHPFQQLRIQQPKVLPTTRIPRMDLRFSGVVQPGSPNGFVGTALSPTVVLPQYQARSLSPPSAPLLKESPMQRTGGSGANQRQPGRPTTLQFQGLATALSPRLLDLQGRGRAPHVGGQPALLRFQSPPTAL